ncbi:MAG: MerR family transcriptional regulator [Chloroflexi bacterium]|nr:MerR family transcriptional regulator [Chloroflexota bacterium]
MPSPFPRAPLSIGQRGVPPRDDSPASEEGGLYIISVAARLLQMHPQTLRKYERIGLINPPRTIGMLRLYSRQDINRLRLIKRLEDDMGMNLAGVEFVLSLLERLREARERVTALDEQEQLREAVSQEFGRLLEMLDFFDEGK